MIPYTPELDPALHEVWNAASGGTLPLTPRLWQQQVTAHPLFQPGDCLIAPAPDGGVAGFALTRILSESDIAIQPDLARDRGRGHVMALAVHPHWQHQGIGRRLLVAADARLRASGATSIRLGGAHGHLLPGPPADTGTGGFWEAAGYRQDAPVYDLRRSLAEWAPPPPPPAVAASAFSYRQGRPGEQDAILAFLHGAFPGGWRYLVAQAFAGGYDPGDITLLCDAAGALRGFLCALHPRSAVLAGSTFWYPLLAQGVWGGIGPLGIAADVRGQGLGLGLVAAGTTYLHGLGVRDCCIDWTTLVGFYGRLGFRPWKQYDVFEKDVSGDDGR